MSEELESTIFDLEREIESLELEYDLLEQENKELRLENFKLKNLEKSVKKYLIPYKSMFALNGNDDLIKLLEDLYK